MQHLRQSFAIAFNMLECPELAIAALIIAAVIPAAALVFVSVVQRLPTAACP